MSVMMTNSFTSFDMTYEEILEGSIFTTSQVQLLQTDLALAAEEKLALEFDTANPTKFIQDEAFKRGQIELLRFMLDRSQNAIDERANPTPIV